MYEIEVDQDTCIGCGTCQAICSEVFELNPENKSQIVEEYRTDKSNLGAAPEDIDCVKDAEDRCPVDAITVE